MLDLEQCPFCNGKLEIATLNCSSGGTPCYCFRCTKCGGIRRFGTLNPADICRECELSSRNRELEAENISQRQAGHRLAMLICDIVLDKKIDEEAMRYAIAKWSKARDKEEE